MKSAGRPIISAIRGRGYSAQAAASRNAEAASLPSQKPKITRLPSGAIVASLENYSPIARLAIFYNAGPRNETGANLGVTHALRNASNLSTQHKTNFGITRTIQQIGGSLTCNTTREHMIYNVDCLRNSVDTALEVLAEVATAPAFKPWEVSDASPRLSLDLACLEQQPQVQLLEGLHKAAFRNTLGQSLYSPANRLGSHTPDMLAQFVQDNYGAGNMAIVGLGIDHDYLVFNAKKFATAQGVAQIEAAKYSGGEYRLDLPGSLTHAAVVTQGVSLGSSDLLAVGVLQRVMGTGPFVKYGTNVSSSKVGKAAANATQAPFAATCINASYSDSGLFGFQVIAQASDIGNVLKSMVATFSEATKGGITDADVQRAKNQMRAAVAMELENGASLLEDIGVQALLSSNVISLPELDAAIAKLTLADVQNVAKKVINSGKPTMSAVGNLSNTPYLDQLL